MKQGWVSIHRKLQDTELWLAEEFTKGQAWIDLILMASHKPQINFIRGIEIKLSRGQIAVSEVEYAKRWKWSRTKVRNFLNYLEKEQQIVQQKTNVTTIVSISNYDLYQEKEQQKEQQNGQQKDSKRTAKEQQKDIYNNVNNYSSIEREYNDFNELSKFPPSQDPFVLLKSKLGEYFKEEPTRIELICGDVRFKGDFQEQLIKFYAWVASKKPEYAKQSVQELLNHFRNWLTNPLAKTIKLNTEPEKPIYTPAKNYNPRG